MTIIKKLSAVLLLNILALGLIAQIPNGYYNGTEDLEGDALRTKLHTIIDNHHSFNYGELYDLLEQTDKKPNGKVWDMYSDVPDGTPPYQYNFGSDECGNYSGEGDCYNKEHTWPKSWFGGKIYPMYSDMFQIVPTDGYVNNRRANYPYGEVGSASWTSQNGCKVGSCNFPGYSGTVFEPIDEYKGDLARGIFYMSTRYYGEDSSWPGSPMTDGADLKPWAINLLLKWHREDPVSQKEIDRCNAVYNLQDNRNPFIDHPIFADKIWDQYYSIAENETYINAFQVFTSKEELHINLLDNSYYEAFEVKIYTLRGQMVLTSTIAGLNNSLSLNNLRSNGCYIVQLIGSDSQKSYHFKIIK